MKNIFLSILMFAAAPFVWAANTVTTVNQVSTEITVSGEVDYVISSDTPFTSSGTINITNTEHAVVILQNVRPSKAINTWLNNRVFINGVQAQNGNNCQVKMFAQGAIILPYSKDIKPLTVYSEKNFGGTSVNSFGLENTGGFMNTLSEAKLNNKIRSFKLKRGYMVTFSTRKEGRGYSRCFIADRADLEIAELPTILDQTISSYRVFHWFNAPKKGLASDTNAADNALVNSSWCYDWATGVNLLPDVECVPNHIYEDWPSASACGSVTYSCHMKTNNEPANSADDHPQDVATVLANWENLMRTGLRLCSPATHDGGWGWHNEFMNAIDARGWRCDIVDFHGYWDGEWNSLDWRIDTYAHGRPVWFSEWVWGASWNNNGAFNVSNRDDFEGNFQRTYNGTKPILDKLNSNSRVERYAYWNGERDCSKIFKGTKLSTLGEYYANMNPGLGYNPAHEFIPKNPPMKDPQGLVAAYNKQEQKVKLTWHEYNGEYNASMDIQVKRAGQKTWTNLEHVELQEGEADYEVAVDGIDGDRFRIRVVDVNSAERLTNEAVAVNESLDFGDGISVVSNNEVSTMYLGGNLLINGDFLLGTEGWTNGAGQPLAYPYFEVVPEGGINNSPYLQCYGNNSSAKHAQSVRCLLKLDPNANYYVGAAGCNNDPTAQHIATSRTETIETNVCIKFSDLSEWSNQGAAITVTDDVNLMIQLRNLAGKAQFDEFRVCRLFATADEALADALLCERSRVEAFIAQHPDDHAEIIADLSSQLAQATDANVLEAALQSAYKAILAADRDALWRELVTDEELSLPFAADEQHYVVTTSGIESPNFSSMSGWTTKCGTYTGGDQRLATQAGLTCWNAWWSMPVSGDEHPTMAIRQTTGALSHGLYALEVKATTQHACATDQHGWMRNLATGDSLATLPLDLGRLDLPGYSNAQRWSTLHSSYLYVEEKGTLEIGFEGSKSAADNGRYIPVGNPTATPDNREGWWCATDFQLRRIPVLFRATDASGWGTLCMPSAFDVPEGVEFYQMAGILADGTAVCLEPVTELLPGYPYLYHTTQPEVMHRFFEHGATVSSAKTNVNGLRGILVAMTSLRYPTNSYRLVNGVFEKVTESGISIPSFSAFIYKESQLPVLESFSGVTLPFGEAGTSLSEVKAAEGEGIYYNLLGQPVLHPTRGIYLLDGKKVVVNN